MGCFNIKNKHIPYKFEKVLLKYENWQIVNVILLLATLKIHSQSIVHTPLH